MKPENLAGGPKAAPSPFEIFKKLMEMLLKALGLNLDNLQKRKKGMEQEQIDMDEQFQQMFKEKMNQETIDSLRAASDKYLAENGTLSKFIGNNLVNQLKRVADNFLDDAQLALDKRNQEEAAAQQKLQATQAPKPEPEKTNAAEEEKEKEKKKQEEDEEEKRKKEEEEEKKKQEEEENKKKKKKNEGEEEEGSKNDKKGPEENDRGEPLKDGMTEDETVDAGKSLGGALKDEKFQKEMGMSEPEKAKSEELGGEADSMKTSRSKSMEPSPPGSSGGGE